VQLVHDPHRQLEVVVAHHICYLGPPPDSGDKSVEVHRGFAAEHAENTGA